jgi:hypothetical protein
MKGLANGLGSTVKITMSDISGITELIRVVRLCYIEYLQLEFCDSIGD